LLTLLRKADGPEPTAKIRLDMQKAMQADAAVFRLVILWPFFTSVLMKLNRTQSTLDEGVQKLRAIYKSFDNVGIKDRSMIWNTCVQPEVPLLIFF
jgi:succinate dehydrogenase (ubiquinone) flavoprotein subunit